MAQLTAGESVTNGKREKTNEGRAQERLKATPKHGCATRSQGQRPRTEDKPKADAAGLSESEDESIPMEMAK